MFQRTVLISLAPVNIMHSGFQLTNYPGVQHGLRLASGPVELTRLLQPGNVKHPGHLSAFELVLTFTLETSVL